MLLITTESFQQRRLQRLAMREVLPQAGMEHLPREGILKTTAAQIAVRYLSVEVLWDWERGVLGENRKEQAMNQELFRIVSDLITNLRREMERH